MAELTTLARPYAKAAFEFALARQSLAAWSEMLKILANVVAQGDIQKLLGNPALTSKQQAEAIRSVCGDSLDQNVGSFVDVLAENKRLILLGEITKLFEQMKAYVEKTLDVQVTTAFMLDSVAENNLVSALAKKLNCDVKVQSTVDTTLIGGIIIRAGDMIIDGSVRGRLTKLAEAMNS